MSKDFPLLEFDGALDEVLGWLTTAEDTLDEFDREIEGALPTIKEALKRFASARAAIKLIREPVAAAIAAEEDAYREQESWEQV